MEKIIKIILIIISIILLIYGLVTDNDTITCLSSLVALLVCLWDLWDDGIDCGTYDNCGRFSACGVWFRNFLNKWGRSSGTRGDRHAVR